MTVADSMKFIKFHNISLISGPIWLFLDLVWWIDLQVYGYRYELLWWYPHVYLCHCLEAMKFQFGLQRHLDSSRSLQAVIPPLSRKGMSKSNMSLQAAHTRELSMTCQLSTQARIWKMQWLYAHLKVRIDSGGKDTKKWKPIPLQGIGNTDLDGPDRI